MERATTDWIAQGPIEVQISGDSTVIDCRWVVRPPAPVDEIALTFADVLSNARAALDYVVWQLVLQNGTVEPGRRHAFPCVTEANKWKDAASRSLAGVGDQWRELIRTMQPFSVPTDEQVAYPFTVLDRLNNTNKHRLPTVADVVPTSFSITLDVDAKPGTITIEEPVKDSGPIHDGKLFLSIRLSRPAPYTLTVVPHLEVQTGFHDDVSNANWRVEELLDWVERALDQFEAAFQ